MTYRTDVKEVDEDYKDLQNDVDEALDRAIPIPSEKLPPGTEAPASATVHAWNTDNFGVLFTIRDTDAKNLYSRVLGLIQRLKADYWKPDWRTNETPIEKKITQKTNQEECNHADIGQKVSSGFNKPENKGKIYNYCLSCKKFISWKQ